MKRLLYMASLIAATIAAVVVTNATTLAQTAQTFIAVTGDWNNGANWTGTSGMLVPEAQFDEAATINNAASVAQVGGAVPPVAALTIGPGAVEIANGGSLSTQPGATLGIGTASINANGRVSVASGGTFSPRSLNLNGTLELTGPNATVNVGNRDLAINGGSNLVAKINSATFKPIAVDGLARIRGGNLSVQFSGFTPTTANTFNLIDADVIDGSFDTVQVTGGAALQPYQVYAINTHGGGSNGTLATLQVDNRLVLSINRANGIGTVMNMAPGSINLDGYSVLSGLGSIAPTSFNSFDDQNLDGSSWAEIGTQSATGIAELRSVGTTSLATGSRAIGAVYDPNPTALGIDPEDLTFHYTNSSGESFEGPVIYQGDKAFNNLVVNINTTTGAATLVNESPFTFSFDGYTVTSASGSLSAAGWNSLQDQAAGGGNWFEIGGTNNNKIGELKRSGSTSLSQGTSFSLGTIFNPAGTRDLTLQFIVSGEDAARTGDVDFQAPAAAVPGDYNQNGKVDAADYVVWRNLNGTSATLPNRDPGQAGNIGTNDYNFWRRNFGNGGAGSGALLGSSAVPEPASVILLTVSCLLFSFAMSRPRR